MTDTWGFSTPLDAGKDLTVAQTAVRNTADRKVVIEAIRPLAYVGSVRYLGAVVLVPPHIGFSEELSHRFPSRFFRRYGHRLPFALSRKGEVAALVLGFRLRGSGFSSFAGIAVDYREAGHEYTATVPLGMRLCLPAKKWFGRCPPVPFRAIPHPKVTSR
jgi:hypothetical protein